MGGTQGGKWVGTVQWEKRGPEVGFQFQNVKDQKE